MLPGLVVGGQGVSSIPPTKVGKSFLHFDSVMGSLVLESCVYLSMTNQVKAEVDAMKKA